MKNWKVQQRKAYWYIIEPESDTVGKFEEREAADLASAAPVMLAALKEMQHISKNFCYVCDARGHEEPLSDILQTLDCVSAHHSSHRQSGGELMRDIIRGIEQGSDAWQQLRLGIPTASAFDRILTPKKLEPSAQQEMYIAELNAEWKSGEPCDDFGGGEWVERGKALEPEARREYAFEAKAKPEEVAFIYKDEQHMVGCSPDALVGDEGLLELKCPDAQNTPILAQPEHSAARASHTGARTNLGCWCQVV